MKAVRQITTAIVAAGCLVALAPAIDTVQAADQGEKSKSLDQESLESLIAKAKTRQDHEAIAARYDAEAKRLENQANHHDKLAKLYGSMTGGKRPVETIALHCRNLANNLRAAAKENAELARLHRETGTTAK